MQREYACMRTYYVCLFEDFRPTTEFFIWRSHHKWRRAANFALCSIGTHGHWALRVLYRVSHTVIRDGHLRGAVTLIPTAERVSVELFTLQLRFIAAGIRTPNLPLAMRMLQPTAASPRHMYILRVNIIPGGICRNIQKHSMSYSTS